MQLAALDDSSHSVKTNIFEDSYGTAVLRDAELVVGKIIGNTPSFDSLLKLRYAENLKTELGSIATVGYSSDAEVVGKVCSMRHHVRQDGEEVLRSEMVSVRRLNDAVAFENGLLDTETHTRLMLYFHQRDMRRMRANHGDTAMVVPHPVFHSDAARFEFSLTKLIRKQ